MGNQAQHRARWLHNRKLLNAIPDSHPDWMVTVLFYTALHAAETLFAFDGTRVHGGHTGRNQTLKRVKRYGAIWARYRPLYDAARVARYEVEPGAQIPVSRVRTTVTGHLYEIERLVLAHLGGTESLPPIW